MTEQNQLPFKLYPLKCTCGSCANLIVLGLSDNLEGSRFVVLRCNTCGEVLFLDTPISNSEIKAPILKDVRYCG